MDEFITIKFKLHMKRISTLLAGFLIVASLFGQMPERISYQAVIRDSNNQLVNNQQVGMRISIIRGSADGMVVYSETLAPETNGNGLVSIEIGGEAGFASIDWSDGPYFLKTETDPSGGTSYTITGTSQLLTVPYALHARTAETISGGISVDYSELTGRPVLSPVVESGNYNDLVGTPELADVALSGAWEDLSDKPSLFDGDYNSLSNLPVLFDGDYNSLNNLPVLFDGDYNSLTNIPILFDGDYNSLTNIPILFDGSYNSLTDKPSLFDGQYSSLSGIPGFAAVAFSGSYDDLSDKPGLQAVALSGEYSDLSGTPDLSDVALSGDFSDLSGVPNFSDVAVSGDYSDLSGTPDLSSYLESESDPVFSASPASSITGAGSGIVISDAERTKLAAIEAEANKYVHPNTHPASMIEQEADLRFMTDAERAKLAAVEAEANKYVHPGTHPASMIVQEADLRFMTDAERTKLGSLENSDGSETRIEAGENIAVSGSGTATDPYVVTVDTGTRYVGEEYGGGIVFYVTPDGKRGLIAARQDQPSVRWFYAQDIISDPDNHDEDGKNYTDWRLPTLHELQILHQEREAVGGFDSSHYWTSRERSSTRAAILRFSDGVFGTDEKTNTRGIRAVRSF